MKKSIPGKLVVPENFSTHFSTLEIFLGTPMAYLPIIIYKITTYIFLKQ